MPKLGTRCIDSVVNETRPFYVSQVEAVNITG